MYKIHPIVVGTKVFDKSMMTYQYGAGQEYTIPIYCWYLEGGDRKILVDTGEMNPIRSETREKSIGGKIYTFEEGLARWDLSPTDIDMIIHTHLHNDHCENDYKCTNAAVYVQKAEHEFLQNPHPVDHRYYPDILDDVQVVEVDGDANITGGIDVILSPGHTVGGQSVAVNTSGGRTVITGFCCNDKNFPSTGPAIAPDVHIDLTEAYDSIQKIKEMADIILPLHDLSIGTRTTIP